MTGMKWIIETLNDIVDAELDALPASLRARITRIIERIEAVGLENVGEPHVKHLEGKLWEIHAMGADGIARALYIYADGTPVGDPACLHKEDAEDPCRSSGHCPPRCKTGSAMTRFSDLKKKWMEDPEFRKEYDALAPEFEVAEMLVSMRRQGQLTQEQMAERLHTTQSAVARLESGRQDPKLSMLRAYADAAGVDLVIAFRPKPGNPGARSGT